MLLLHKSAPSSGPMREGPLNHVCSLLGGGTSNTWFVGSARVHTPNGISIGSSVSAGFTARDRQTDTRRRTTLRVTTGRILCYACDAA